MSSLPDLVLCGFGSIFLIGVWDIVRYILRRHAYPKTPYSHCPNCGKELKPESNCANCDWKYPPKPSFPAIGTVVFSSCCLFSLWAVFINE